MSWEYQRGNVVWGLAALPMLFATGLLLQFIAAEAETHIPFLMHSSERRIIHRIRTEKSICWLQEFDKYKAGRIEALNYYLSDDKGNLETSTPMRALNTNGDLPSPPGLNTGEPPKISEETPVGTNIRTSFCQTLPTWAKPDSIITAWGSIEYDGAWSIFGIPLWKYSIPVPVMYFYPCPAGEASCMMPGATENLESAL